MPYPTFDDYWLAYLGAHSKPGTRLCHYIGTSLGLFAGLAASVFVVWWGFLVLGFIGYGIAIASHPLVQGNRPFARQPVWGFASDLRVLWLAVTGRLQPHLDRAARASPGEGAMPP
jgi:hypothetical protein